MTQIAETTNPSTDLNADHWLIRRLPETLRPYALLARWDRPVGFWLLVLPTLWALVLAGESLPSLHHLLVFIGGAWLMRGAGCTVNDILDRDLDRQVERTRTRPLAQGLLTVKQAVGFLAAQTAIAGVLLLTLTPLAITLGCLAVIPVGVYPLMKRIAWWPQVFLGVTFNLGILIAWAAVRGTVDLTALCLYAGSVLWTVGYDTIYAHMDREDDKKVGIKSTALFFSGRAASFVYVMYILALSLWFVSGLTIMTGRWFAAGLGVAALLLGWQMHSWKPDDPANCLRTFKLNIWVGVAVLAGAVFTRLAG